MLYLDTSFIAPLVIPEPSSDAIEAYLRRNAGAGLLTSLWTQVELASLVARRIRMGDFDAGTAAEVRGAFSRILAESFTMLVPAVEDFTLAAAFLAEPRTGLRAADALHLSVAANREVSTILTLDNRLISAGRLLKLPIKRGIRG